MYASALSSGPHIYAQVLGDDSRVVATADGVAVKDNMDETQASSVKVMVVLNKLVPVVICAPCAGSRDAPTRSDLVPDHHASELHILPSPHCDTARELRL